MSRNRLLLMRHAKSDWSHPGLDDKERPLNARGRDAAPRIAKWIVDNKVMPSIIACSTAVRTQQTLELLQQTWDELFLDGPTERPAVVMLDELYLASANSILSIASQQPTHASILVIGHNPGMSDLASYLANKPLEMPTAAISMHEAIDERWPKSWLDVNSWQWRGLVKPRDLSNE